jgi:ribosome-binding factor A
MSKMKIELPPQAMSSRRNSESRPIGQSSISRWEFQHAISLFGCVYGVIKYEADQARIAKSANFLHGAPFNRRISDDRTNKDSMKSHRLARVSEVAREVAAEAILFEVKDPRVKMVTVTRAEVSADLQHCKIFVSVMGSEKDAKLTLHGLTSAAGFVQSKLAKRLTTRYVPHVQFILDEGLKKAAEVARLLKEAEDSRKLEEPSGVDTDDENDTDNEEDNDKA